MSNTEILLEPSLAEWFIPSREALFRCEIVPCVPLLKEAKLLKQVIKSFICRECLREHPGDDILNWANYVWGHQIDQMFLEHKDKLDQISYRLLRVSSQGLAFELYHRLLSNEDTFERLSVNYGEGPERFSGGLFKLQNVESLPQGISSYLLRLKIGDIQKPISMSKKFGILQLAEFVPADRGDSTERRLLERQFELWVSGMTDYLCVHLKLND